MKIGILQTKVYSDLDEILNQIQTYAKSATKQGAQILVLPEIWNAPYDNEQMLKSVSEFNKCDTFLSKLSKEFNCVIVGGSLAHKIENKIYNECTIYDKGKKIASYAKTHLFEVHTSKGIYQEKEVFTPGNRFVTFETEWGKMGILICYDIRFPLVSRHLAKEGAKILFCPAAFNKRVTMLHWTPLFQTRAMENQVYIVGVNPAHYKFKRFETFGHSIVTDPFGQIVSQMDENEGFQVIEINLNKIESIRDRMPFSKIEKTDLYKGESI